MFKFRFVAIPLTGLSILAIGANVFAQSGSVLKFVVGSSSFVSPLIELYGDVSLGEKSFIRPPAKVLERSTEPITVAISS